MLSRISRYIRALKNLAMGITNYEPISQIGHLSFTLPAAAREVIMNREMDRKIREKWYANKLTLVAAMTKAASKVIGASLAAVLGKTKTFGPYMTANEDSDLRPEMVQGLPDGAVIEYQVRCTGKNLKVIDLLGIKYVILLRHPADQLTANYCDLQRSFVMEAERFESSSKGERVFYDHIYPLDIVALAEALATERPSESIDLLIRDGYLHGAMGWACDWLRFRDPDRSIVLRYEDFIADQEAELTRITHFLTGADPGKAGLARSKRIAEEYAAKRIQQKRDHKIYERGWTGHKGAWKAYFSDANKRHYQTAVKGFLDCWPRGDLLLKVYPDLLDLDES